MNFKSLLKPLVPVVFGMISVPELGAAGLQWDSDPATPGVQSGNGNWDDSNTRWWNGSTNVKWDGADATFGAGDYTVVPVGFFFSTGITAAGATGKTIISATVSSVFSVSGIIDVGAVGRELQLYATTPGTLSGNAITKTGAGVLSIYSPIDVSIRSITLSEGTLGFVARDTWSSTTLVLNAGAIGSMDGVARTVFGPTTIGGDISIGTGNGLGTGHLQFASTVSLGGGTRTLTIGSGGSTLSGLVSDGGIIKAGANGSLTLSRATGNSYAGGTTVSGGKLLVTNTSGSATGTGTVTVDLGAVLGGTGSISGAATVAGTITGGDVNTIGTLTFSNALVLAASSTYSFQINSAGGLSDRLVANGVTLGAGSFFEATELGINPLAQGTVFTLINNTSAAAINGTFQNVAEGDIFLVGKNALKFSYIGGSGNDFTATVVPEPSLGALLLLGSLPLFRRRR